MKEKIETLLLGTERKGIEKLLEWMNNNGFYSAPCSGQHHLSKIGGLAEHSLNVCNMAISLKDTFEWQPMPHIDTNSVIIASLLHDLGKSGQYGKPNYIENYISDRKGGFKQSETKPFVTNQELLSVPHEVRSIQIASQFIELTEEESYTMLMHNGMYGDFKYTLQGKETPLYMIIHFADMWCSRVIEKETESED